MPYKEGPGKWRAKVYYNGKPYTKRCKTKKEALGWEADKREELRNQASETLTDSLLKVATEYLSYCEKNLNRTTFTNKKLAIKELMAVTGNVAIQDVSPRVILHDVLMKQRTPHLFNKRRKDLSAFFQYCRDFYGLQYNPVTVIKKLPTERKAQPTPTEEEFLRLLAAADRHDRNLLVAYATTGGRRSEILRWTWTEDINFQERQVRLGNRKNKAREMRYRWVEMNDELYRALRDQYKTRLPQSDFVFQNRNQRQAKYGQGFTQRHGFMKRLCKRAKIDKPLGYHSLRRFFASLLADNRESLPTIQKLLGHSNVSITDRYVQHLRDDTRAAVNKIDFSPAPISGETGQAPIDETDPLDKTESGISGISGILKTYAINETEGKERSTSGKHTEGAEKG